MESENIIDDIDDDYVGDAIIIPRDQQQKIIIIEPHLRRSSSILSESEITEIVCVRSAQIDKTGLHFTDASGLSDSIAISKRELLSRRCPLLLRRRVGEKPFFQMDQYQRKVCYLIEIYVEIWNPNEMGFSMVP